MVACTLSHAFSGPGERVTVTAEIENRGFAYSPVDALGQSAAGLQIVLVSDAAQERIVEVSSVPSLPPGGKTTIKLTVEMPHDPVRLRAQLSPNPIDRDLKNNWQECWFGTPAPRDVICEIVTSGDPSEPEAQVTYPRLSWTNVGIYDEVLLYRNGSMLAALSGSATSFADLNASPKPHTYV